MSENRNAAAPAQTGDATTGATAASLPSSGRNRFALDNRSNDKSRSKDPFFRSIAALRGLLKVNTNDRAAGGKNSGKGGRGSGAGGAQSLETESLDSKNDDVTVESLKRELEEARNEAAKERSRLIPLEKALEQLSSTSGSGGGSAGVEKLLREVELKAELEMSKRLVEKLQRENDGNVTRLTVAVEARRELELQLGETKKELQETQSLLRAACEQQHEQESEKSVEPSMKTQATTTAEVGNGSGTAIPATTFTEKIEAFEKVLTEKESLLRQKDERIDELQKKVRRLDMSEASLQREIRRLKKDDTTGSSGEGREVNAASSGGEALSAEESYQEVVHSLQQALEASQGEVRLLRAAAGGEDAGRTTQKKRGRDADNGDSHDDGSGDDIEVVNGASESKRPRESDSGSGEADSALEYEKRFHI